MTSDFPAIATGVITRLPEQQQIGKDGATHMLANPSGSFRLRPAGYDAANQLEAVEARDIPVLVKGHYVTLGHPFIVVHALARIDLVSLGDGVSVTSGKGWKLTPIADPDPGDGWPFRVGGVYPLELAIETDLVQQPEKIHEVLEISVKGGGDAPNWNLCAKGTVNSGGWNNAVLLPQVYSLPPTDGIQDFDFCATPPQDLAIQVVSELYASTVLEQTGWLKGVRVHAISNTKEAMLR